MQFVMPSWGHKHLEEARQIMRSEVSYENSCRIRTLLQIAEAYAIVNNQFGLLLNVNISRQYYDRYCDQYYDCYIVPMVTHGKAKRKYNQVCSREIKARKKIKLCERSESPSDSMMSSAENMDTT